VLPQARDALIEKLLHRMEEAGVDLGPELSAAVGDWKTLRAAEAAKGLLVSPDARIQ